MKVVTKDLYEGAYLLARGGRVEKIEVDRSRARPSVFFILAGEEVLAWEREFRSGQAMVEVRLFKASMMFLKDQMFSKLRGEQGEGLHGGHRERSSGA